MGKTKRLLLAEDNPYDHELLDEAFRAQGLRVEIDAVLDGDRLLELLRQPETLSKRYGLILLDAHLPKRSATDVLETLRAEGKAIGPPFAVASSIMTESRKAFFLDLGARMVLSKPGDLDEYIAFAHKLHGIFVDVE